ncbi:hypothetical protein GAYE_SCF47G5884 [Galdieria yellowstonensis]|uniref:C3H1-type domain-containing protein n=1 Tax=Galdieria yellowstonensis TaxID=3028027 RepID=A0AAV9IKB3_9RHOD|nr:hypothetical protein GAYE_SCF47G5884 [Galdieria yellowstonensis]
MTSFQEQQGELEDGELQETSVFDVSHPSPTTMWTASHRDERGGPVSSHLVPSYPHSFPPTTTTTTASSSFSSPSRGRKRPPKRGMSRMTWPCPTSRTNNNNNNNNDGGTSFPPHVASIVGGMDPLGTNTTTSMVNIGDQVIQVISSLLAQGFQVPMDWFQNPQIYQWLVEWVRQSKSTELATTKSSWAPPSGETPSGWTLGTTTTKTMDDYKESPGESIGTNNNYSMNNKKNNHESYPSIMPTNPKKSRPYTKKIPKKPKKSRNWTIYTTPRKQQEVDNTKLENPPNEQPQEMTIHEQYQHTEPKKQSSTLEELRNQAKMALKSSVDNATRDVVNNKASQESSPAKQQQVTTNHEEKEPGKTTSSPKENPSSSLVITVEDSESNHSASGGDEKNTSRSRWSTLEELRRRVQELEERKKQYLQKRAKSTEEEHKKKIAKSNHLFSDSTLPLSSTPTMTTTTTPKDETQRKEEQDDHSEEAKAWMERLEREAARAWEEHDKSITEEIEARNKLIRMRTCEETARESSRILKELWKKSRMDIQQYARQANAMEKQIEQIEVQRRRSLAIAEKSQRKLERLRRWIAMESLMDKEIDFAHPSSLSIFWEPHLSSSRRRPRSSYAYEKEETTIQSNQVANIYSPSPMTRNSWKPWMSMFRCFPLLHEVTEDVQLMTWYNDISWDIEICRYDLHGSCSDPDCKFQHADKYCHPSIHVVFKKIEKSCCTLFWLRYGMEPDEKRCQALKRTLHSLLYSTKHKEEEKETWRQYFRATIPQLVVEWLQSSSSSSEEKEEQSMIAWTTTGEDHAMDDTWDYGKYSSLSSRYFLDTP